jgi:hypothetical protein
LEITGTQKHSMLWFINGLSVPLKGSGAVSVVPSMTMFRGGEISKRWSLLK